MFAYCPRHKSDWEKPISDNIELYYVWSKKWAPFMCFKDFFHAFQAKLKVGETGFAGKHTIMPGTTILSPPLDNSVHIETDFATCT